MRATWLAPAARGEGDVPIDLFWKNPGQFGGEPHLESVHHSLGRQTDDLLVHPSLRVSRWLEFKREVQFSLNKEERHWCHRYFEVADL